MKHRINNNIIKFFALVLAALAMSACQNDGDTVSLNVEIDQFPHQHKTYIDNEYYTCWSNGDQISINGTAHPIVIDGNRCRVNNITIQNSYTAVTPASLTSTSATVQDQVIAGLRLPSSYTHSSTNIPVVMAAYLGSQTGTISFHNACIVLQLNIANNYSRTLRLADIQVSDDLAPLSGLFDITGLDNNTPALVAQSGNDTTHSVTIQPDAANPIDLTQGGTTTVYVVLPPTDNYANNKFTITVNAVDYQSATQGTIIHYQFQHSQADNASGAIPRNTLLPITIPLDSPHTTVLHGLGTSDNPYLIQQKDDLYAMSRLVNSGFDPVGLGEPFASSYYRLTSDLFFESSDPELVPIGTALNNFTGHFDGGTSYHQIWNLRVSGTDCVGLFGHISNGASIKNLNIRSIQLTASATNAMIGSFCGHADRSIIDRCAVDHTVTINCPNASTAYIGGIVGNLAADRQDASSLYNCYNSCQLSVTGNGNLHVGGIAGRLFNSAIVNAYIQTAQINAPSAAVGGIAARSDGASSIINCYKGKIQTTLQGATGRVGDICSYIGPNTHILYCYYPSQLYATGNPTPSLLSNNLLYNSYLHASPNSVDGLTTLTDYLQFYVNTFANNSSVSLCDWQGYTSASGIPDIAPANETTDHAPYLDFSLSSKSHPTRK